MARVGRVDSLVGERHLTASIDEFGRFETPVPAFGAGRAYESALFKRNWHSIVQRSVRAIPDAELLAILDEADPAAAFKVSAGFGEVDQTAYLSEQRDFDFVARARRWLGLRQLTRAAYAYRCSFTGCGQRGNGGELEAECCHIWPVSDGGPDTVSNTLLLGRSMHWAFDRHLISLNDDFSFIVADGLTPEYRRMLNPDGYARVPEDPHQRPSAGSLRRHRGKMTDVRRP